MYLRRIHAPQYGLRPWCNRLANIQSSPPMNLHVLLQFNSASPSRGCRGTGFCDDSVLQRPTAPKTIERTTLSSPCWASTSRHLSPNNSLCLNPVDAAKRTRVRSGLWFNRSDYPLAIDTAAIPVLLRPAKRSDAGTLLTDCLNNASFLHAAFYFWLIGSQNSRRRILGQFFLLSVTNASYVVVTPEMFVSLSMFRKSNPDNVHYLLSGRPLPGSHDRLLTLFANGERMANGRGPYHGLFRQSVSRGFLGMSMPAHVKWMELGGLTKSDESAQASSRRGLMLCAKGLIGPRVRRPPCRLSKRLEIGHDVA